MVYPYLTNDISLRMKLIRNKIFVASYWSGINDINNFTNTIIPLPIDQRYDKADMDKILKIILNK